MSAPATEPTELVPEPPSGRVYEEVIRPGIADVVGDGRDGRARLDAIARWIQDVAYHDLIEAGFGDRGAWVVRRARIRVESFPRFREQLVMRTFCSGIGRFSAERRTTIGGGSARVETVALWVWLDAESWRPTRFGPDFLAAYSESAAGRGASPRRRHPEPPADAEVGSWRFRACDLDIAGHVNNSHYWELLEEELAGDPDPAPIDAEIEFREPAHTGDAVVLRSGEGIWVGSPAQALHASILRW